MAGISELKEFIDYAEKNRKYARQTAKGRRAALRLFEAELSDDERNSLEMIESRFEKIYSAVFQRNKKDITASSLTTYKSRMIGLIKDYRLYGIDPNAFTAWDTTRKHEGAKPVKHSSSGRVKIDAELMELDQAAVLEKVAMANNLPLKMDPVPSTLMVSELNRIEYFLRPNFRVSLSLPADLTEREASRLKHMIDGMVDNDKGGI